MNDLGIPPEINRAANILCLALENWAKKSKGYSLLFKTLSEDVLQVARDAFSELDIIKPGIYELWWLKNHNRYIRRMKARELSLLHEIMYHFLTAYARGELEKPVANGSAGNSTGAPKTRRKS